jgi:hypothetical protein
MTDPADPADLTPPGNPADYRPGFRPGRAFWAVMVFGLICILSGIVVGRLLPVLWPAKPPAERTSTVSPPAIPTVDTEQAPSTPNLSGGPPPAAPAPSAEVSLLAGRVAALESLQARTADAAAASLAASSLADAARNSGPFETTTSLAVLERMLPMSPDIQALRDIARTGAPSRAALAASFDAAATQAAIAARDPGERGGLVARLKFILASIITIRRTSEAGSGPDAVLARAERQVGEGNIEGAVKTLAALPPKASDAMAAWREKAQRRVELDRRVAAVRSRALADLMAASQARPFASGTP